MNPSRRSQSRSRPAKRRGVVALEELLSMAALMACFVGPIAVAARSVGPELAKDMDRRVHAVKNQKPNTASAAGMSGGGLDFGSAVPAGMRP